MTAPLLTLDKVEVAYHHAITAVQGVSLSVGEGQLVALLGTNGAGKTTTLRAISGFIGLDDAKVTQGTITFAGQRIDNQPPHLLTALGIVIAPERNKVFDQMTVAENLEVPVGGGDRKKRMEAIYTHFPQLAAARKRHAGYLSGGERQMLVIASALLCSPRLLLVDEMSLGLAPVVVDQLMAQIKAIQAEMGLTILLVEQNAHVALDGADYGYVMESGRVVLDGTPERLLGHQDVQEFYLGQGGGGDRRSYRDVKQYRRNRRWYG